MSIADVLQRLGFSEYEAKAYVGLLQRSPINGYELARLSGVPRPNVYGVLQRLEERGAIARVETPAGTRYVPVPPAELVRRLDDQFHEVLDAARRLLEHAATPPNWDYIWNVRGYPVLLDHARSLLAVAQERLLLAVWPHEARALADHLAKADARGVQLTTLCLQACPEECGACRGQVYRYKVPLETDRRWLVLLPDDSELLAGEIDRNENAIAVRTRQELLVELASWYIWHSIGLAAVMEDLGPRLGDLLSPGTKRLLSQLMPGGGWLARVRQALRRGHSEGAGDAPNG